MLLDTPTNITPSAAGRVDRLRARFDELGVDAFLVVDKANRRYLSGFTGSAGFLLVTREEQFLSTDSRYYTQVATEVPHFELVQAGYGYLQGLNERVGLAGKRVGIEKEVITLDQFDKFCETCADTTWVPTSMVVNALRAIKDADELALMRQTIIMGDQALAATLPYCKPGVTENQIITKYLNLVREVGADGTSYDPIFGAGPNGAIVHHRGSDRPLEAGDVLLVDAGVQYKGYCSDLTRVFAIEHIDPEMKALYDIVLEAHLLGYEVTGDGVPAKEVDLKTRQVIEDAGYGEYYGHSLGHGIGLEVHESPRVSRLSPDILQTGMLHTIEPGIYIPGKGGIRIEDICWLSPEGPVQLTTSPKEMLVLQY
ncbi:MAG: Xaa-Pro peptidase family protein [bacterium]